jgi:hypothetical protein
MHHGISGEFVTRVFMIPKMARGLSETDLSRPTGGHPATSTGFRAHRIHSAQAGELPLMNV